VSRTELEIFSVNQQVLVDSFIIDGNCNLVANLRTRCIRAAVLKIFVGRPKSGFGGYPATQDICIKKNIDCMGDF